MSGASMRPAEAKYAKPKRSSVSALKSMSVPQVAGHRTVGMRRKCASRFRYTFRNVSKSFPILQKCSIAFSLRPLLLGRIADDVRGAPGEAGCAGGCARAVMEDRWRSTVGINVFLHHSIEFCTIEFWMSILGVSSGKCPDVSEKL